MKTNGYIFFILAFLWLINCPVAISQRAEASKTRDQISYTQIDKYPEDLISIQVRNSANYRNTHSSYSEIATYQPDSILYYSSLALYGRETYCYDLNGNLVSLTKETRGESGWLNSEMRTFTYDNNGNVLTELRKTWVGIFWEKTYLFTYTYDTWGNMLTYLVQNWVSGKWNNAELYTYIYSISGNVLSCLVQSWNYEKVNNEYWENKSYCTNHYDERGNLDLSLSQNWVDYSWVNSFQNLNTFNIEGFILTSLTQIWNGSDWTNSGLKTWTYDENDNNLTYIEQFWGNTEWINAMLTTRTFNEKGKILSELSQLWMDTWDNISNSIFTYDENGNCTSGYWYSWNYNSWANSLRVDYEYEDGLVRGIGYYWGETGWVPGDAMLDLQLCTDGDVQFFCEWWGSKTEVYYSSLYTGAPEQSHNSDVFSIYPNPAGDLLHISYNVSETAQTCVSIYDLSGKKIESNSYGNITPGNQTVELNTSDLAPGIYILKINSGISTSTCKVTITR